MKENIIDLLMYLFENYMDDEHQFDQDQEVLRLELLEAGFPGTEISKAFEWLEGLAEQPVMMGAALQSPNAIRIYRTEESERLDVDCRGFLQFLEQIGVLDTNSRELVIDRVMALGSEDFDLEQLKWVVLMVLFNQPGQEAAFAWMEDLVYEEAHDYLH